MSFTDIVYRLAVLAGITFLLIKERPNKKIVIDENGKKVKSGLGGWLIPLAFLVVISPLNVITNFGQRFIFLFSNGFYEAFFSVHIWGAIIINAIVIAIKIYLIFLFFGKRALFPKLYILDASIPPIFFLTRIILIKISNPNEIIFGSETIGEFMVIGIQAIIFVSYMLFSKRVKATFVNKIEGEISIEQILGAIFIIVYFGVGIIQWSATIDGLKYWFGISSFFAYMISGFISYIPIVGTIAGFKGAIDVWGWSFLEASTLFFGPVIVAIIAIILFSLIYSLKNKE